MVTRPHRIEQRQRLSANLADPCGVGEAIALGFMEDTTSMSKILKSAIAAAVLTIGVWFASVTPSYAKPEYAKAEGKACGYCHVTSGKPEPTPPAITTPHTSILLKATSPPIR